MKDVAGALTVLLASVVAASTMVCGLSALVLGFEDRLTGVVEARERELGVLVAARDLAPGHTVVPEDLSEVWVPRDIVPAEAILRDDQLVGRVVLDRVLGGELIRTERLARDDVRAGLHALVPEGMRALSFNVSGAERVGSFVQPSSRVDVIVSLFDDHGEVSETATLLQGVQVLAVDERTADGAVASHLRFRPQVTVAVEPSQAQTLTHALERGRVRLALRGDTDLAWYGKRGERPDHRLGSAASTYTITDWYLAKGLEAP